MSGSGMEALRGPEVWAVRGRWDFAGWSSAGGALLGGLSGRCDLPSGDWSCGILLGAFASILVSFLSYP